MTNYSDITYPPFRGEKKFQDFCLTLARKYWKDPFATLHTRSGQADFSVDITGYDQVNGLNPVGMQCKGSESNTPRKLTKKILTDTVEEAKGFSPPLHYLIVASNGPKDGEIVREAIKITKEHEGRGLFRVIVWAWDDLLAEAQKLPEVMQWLFAQYEYPIATELDPSRPGGEITLHVYKFRGLVQDAQPELYQGEYVAKAGEDPVNDERINVFKGQIAAGHGATVIAPLQEFIASLSEGTNPKTSFRAYANLGAAFIQAGRFEDAINAFKSASDAVPGTADAHAYAARIAVFREEPETAHEQAAQALQLDARHKVAAAIYLDTAPKDADASELEALVAQIVGEFDVGWALSRAYTDRGQHEDALRVARGIETKPENWARGIAIGEAILHRFDNDLEMRTGAPLSQDTAALIKEAQEQLGDAWATIKVRTDKENWSYVGLNFAAAFMAQGDEHRSDELAFEVFAMAPTLAPAKQRAALAYLHKGQIDQAITLATEVASSGAPDDLLYAASLLTLKQSWASIKEMAQRAFEAASGETKAQAAELLITAELQVSGPQAAHAIAENIRSQIVPSIGFEGQATEIARRLGDEAAVALGKQRLEEFESGALNPMQRFELSEAYADDGQFGKAADLLEGLHPLDRPSELLRRRLFHLYRSERREDARELFEEVEPHLSSAKETLRLGAAIFDRSGMLPRALAIIEKALAADEDLGTRLDWCRLCLRTDHEPKMIEWLQKADANVTGRPKDILGFAKLLNRYGRREDALRIAYKTLRENWGKDEQLHTMYMSLFLGGAIETDEVINPPTVSVDSVVFLRNQHGRTTHYRIEADVEPQADVLPPQSPLAQALLGAKVGETRLSPAGIGQPESWKITGILHKYIELFQAVMNSHTALFPDAKGFGSFHIEPGKEGGLEPIFEQVRARAKRAADVANLYRDNVLPIDSVGRMLGIDAIDASLGMRGDQGIRIDTCLGTSPERQAALSQLAEADVILVDPLTIAIWAEIDLLPILAGVRRPKIEIVQATLDNFGTRIKEAELSLGRGSGSLIAQGDRIVMIESDDAQKNETIQMWTNVEKWCRAHATVIPTETSAELKGADIEQIISRFSADTIATAAKTKKLLLSDDRRLRMLAQAIGANRLAWTQVFLMHLVKDGQITPEQYAKFCAALERSKIGFVSVSTRDLVAVHSDRDTFAALAAALTLPNVNSVSLVGVFCEFAVITWLDPAMAKLREPLIGIISEGILVRPDGLAVFHTFISVMYAALSEDRFSMGTTRESWSDYIQRFAKGHFIFEELMKL